MNNNKNKIGRPNDHKTRNLGPIIRVCQLNIEGISRSKSEILSKILKLNDIDLVILQETHATDSQQLTSRGKITGYELLGATYHHAYGNATYIRNNIENAKLISCCTKDNIHSVTIKIADTHVTNIYKPPNDSWPSQVIQPSGLEIFIK